MWPAKQYEKKKIKEIIKKKRRKKEKENQNKTNLQHKPKRIKEKGNKQKFSEPARTHILVTHTHARSPKTK